jgi:hypothetical protein
MADPTPPSALQPSGHPHSAGALSGSSPAPVSSASASEPRSPTFYLVDCASPVADVGGSQLPTLPPPPLVRFSIQTSSFTIHPLDDLLPLPTVPLSRVYSIAPTPAPDPPSDFAAPPPTADSDAAHRPDERPEEPTLPVTEQPPTEEAQPSQPGAPSEEDRADVPDKDSAAYQDDQQVAAGITSFLDRDNSTASLPGVCAGGDAPPVGAIASGQGSPIHPSVEQLELGQHSPICSPGEQGTSGHGSPISPSVEHIASGQGSPIGPSAEQIASGHMSPICLPGEEIAHGQDSPSIGQIASAQGSPIRSPAEQTASDHCSRIHSPVGQMAPVQGPPSAGQTAPELGSDDLVVRGQGSPLHPSGEGSPVHQSTGSVGSGHGSPVDQSREGSPVADEGSAVCRDDRVMAADEIEEVSSGCQEDAGQPPTSPVSLSDGAEVLLAAAVRQCRLSTTPGLRAAPVGRSAVPS